MTIKDIAKIAGVGVSTVSRAINGHPDINAETKERIFKIIAENNYSPNNNAKNLKQSSGKSVLMLIKGNMNMFFSAVSEHISKSTLNTDYTFSVQYLSEHDNEVAEAIKIFREQKPIGIIFLGADLENFNNDFYEITVPCVVATVNAKELEFKNLSSVSINDFEAGKKAIDYLFEQGHQNIGIISGDFDTSNPSQLRYAGIKHSFMAHGQDIKNIPHEKSSYSCESAYEAVMALIQKKPEITAVFAMSDVMAMGAIRAILDSGKKVPEDVSVMGFDGIELSSYYNPTIATMEQPSEKIASLSVRLITDMIENGTEGSHLQLRATFKSGSSICRR